MPSGRLAVDRFDPLLLEELSCGLFEELGCGPLVDVEVVLDVPVAEHEVLADLDRDEVLRRQVRDHVDVLDALVGVLDVEVERLLVQDGGGGVLVLVRPPADLDHALHEGDDQLGVLLRHLLVQVMTAGMLATCRVQSG